MITTFKCWYVVSLDQLCVFSDLYFVPYSCMIIDHSILPFSKTLPQVDHSLFSSSDMLVAFYHRCCLPLRSVPMRRVVAFASSVLMNDAEFRSITISWRVFHFRDFPFLFPNQRRLGLQCIHLASSSECLERLKTACVHSPSEELDEFHACR